MIYVYQCALLEDPHETILYHGGSVSEAQNAVPGLLRREPGPRVNHVSDQLNLFRKLPNLTEFLTKHRLITTFTASDKVLDAVPPVVDKLRALSDTGTVAVVHCRRGDKITSDRYCPEQMHKATSPQRIAEVLAAAGVTPGSAFYLMSSDLNLTHFAPLARTYGYRFLTQDAFPHLANLMTKCLDPTADGFCENFLLYAIENEIMRAVDRKFRFVTLPKKDMDHNPETLFSKYKGECTPH